MTEAVFVSAVRTPIGNFGGSLKDIPAYDLAALVLNELIKKVGLSAEQIEMVLLGQNYQNGEYVNIARMALLTAGWPVEIPGLTIDRRCPSGLDALCLANTLVESGQVSTIVAGGVESMSTSELYLPGDIRWGLGGSGDAPRGHGSLATWGVPLYDRVQRGRVMSQPSGRFGVLPSMMSWAETAAKEHNLSREEVDRWALASNQRACAAMDSGKFDNEIVPVPIPQRKGDPVMFTKDERPRADTSLEALGKLRPVMDGVCTAGNSSGENDGASVCLLMTRARAEELKVKPLARLRSFAFGGADPRYAWKAATIAVQKALAKAGLTLDQIDLIEIHEAFAAQALANFRELGIAEKDYDKVNVNGSCVSLGHPLGATGARITTTLLNEMQRRHARYGLIGICGGGMGIGAILESV
ncbi:MAG: acetyl-CoA C-acyltransferase [Chloroflexota bacterium]